MPNFTPFGITTPCDASDDSYLSFSVDTTETRRVSTYGVWDLAGAAHEGFIAPGLANGGQGFSISADGTHVVSNDGQGNSHVQYTLSTPWDLSTNGGADAGNTTIYTALNVFSAVPRSHCMKADGTKMYVVGDDAYVYQFSLTPGDLDTVAYDSVRYSTGKTSNPWDIKFKPDGTSFWIMERGTDILHRFNMTTPWNISTASDASEAKAFTAQATAPMAFAWAPHGYTLFVADLASTVYQYWCTTAWDSTSAVYESKTIATTGQLVGLEVDQTDGEKIFVGRYEVNHIEEYILSTGQTPDCLTSIFSLNYNCEYKVSGAVTDDTYALSLRIMYGDDVLAADAVSGTLEVVDADVTNTTDTNSGVVAFTYVNQNQVKAKWDASWVEIKQSYAQGGSFGDSLFVRVDHVELSGVYYCAAWVPIFEGDFTNACSDNYTWQIQQYFDNDPGGSPAALESAGRSFLTTTWALEEQKDEWSPFMPSESTLTFYDTSSNPSDQTSFLYEYIDALNEQEANFRLAILDADDSDRALWYGFIDTASVQLREDDPQYTWTINAHDGLNDLEDILFVETTDPFSLFTGRVLVTDLIAQCLAFIPWGHGFKVGCEFYPYNGGVELAATANPLANVYVDRGNYSTTPENDNELPKAYSVKRVLRDVCQRFGLRLAQWDGYWYLFPIDSLYDVSYRLWGYDANGVYDTYTDLTHAVTLATDPPKRGPGSLSVLRPYSAVEVRYNHGPALFLQDPLFITEADDWFNNKWTASGATSVEAISETIGVSTGLIQDYYRYILASVGAGNRISAYNQAGTGAGTIDNEINTAVTANEVGKLTQTAPDVPSSTKLVLNLVCVPTAKNPELVSDAYKLNKIKATVQIVLQGTSTKYLTQNGTWSDTVQWILVDLIPNTWNNLVLFPTGTTATPFFGDVTITLGPALEEPVIYSGTPSATSYLMDDFIWGRAQMAPVLASGTVNATTRSTVNYVSRTRNTVRPIEVLIGDGPTSYNASRISWDLYGYDSTDTWKEGVITAGDPGENLDVVLGRVALRAMNKARRVHSAMYYDTCTWAGPPNAINYQDNRWAPLEITIDYEGAKESGTWCRLRQDSFTDDTDVRAASTRDESRQLTNSSNAIGFSLAQVADYTLGAGSGIIAFTTADIPAGSGTATISVSAIDDAILTDGDLIVIATQSHKYYTVQISADQAAGATTLSIEDPDNPGSNFNFPELIEAPGSVYPASAVAAAAVATSNLITDLAASGDYSGRTTTRTAATGISFAIGEVGTLDYEGNVIKADASATDTCNGFLLMAVEAISSGGSGRFLVPGGTLRHDTNLGTGHDENKAMYVSETGGAITATAPTNARLVGRFSSEETFYFNPYLVAHPGTLPPTFDLDTIPMAYPLNGEYDSVDFTQDTTETKEVPLYGWYRPRMRQEFDVASQATYPRAIGFDRTGAKMLVSEGIGDTIYQYTLSRPWDVSSAAYDTKSLSTTGIVAGSPSSVSWKPDGTKVYVADFAAGGYIETISLSTAWDISTGSDATETLDPSTELANTRGHWIMPDGLTVYVVGEDSGGNATVARYTCSSAWDLSTASYASDELDFSAQAGSGGKVMVSDDGLKMLLLESEGPIFEYSMSSANDLSTASYQSRTFDPSADETYMDQGQCTISFDGYTLYFVDRGTSGNDDTIRSWTLSDPWNLTNRHYDNDAPSYNGTATPWTDYTLGTTCALRWDDDGSHIIIANRSNNYIYRYAVDGSNYYLSTDVTVAQSANLAGQHTTLRDFEWVDSGNGFWTLDENGTVYRYTVSSPYTLSTVTYASDSFDSSTQVPTAYGFAVKPDGGKMYVAGTGRVIYQYDCSSANDLSTCGYATKSLDLTSVFDTSIDDITFSSDGLSMWVHGQAGKKIIYCPLTTAWDLSTASAGGEIFDGTTFDATGVFATGFTFDSSYTRMALESGDRWMDFYRDGTPNSDFNYMSTVSWTCKYKLTSNPGSDTYALGIRVTAGSKILAAADSGGTFATVDADVDNTTMATVGPTAFAYVNATATKNDWHNAVVELKQTYTQIGTIGAAENIEVWDVDLTATYVQT